MTVQAKAKVRDRHREAIQAFEQWLAKNPDAPPSRKFKTFDMYVDAVELERALKK